MNVPVKQENRPVGDWGVPENWRRVPLDGGSVPEDDAAFGLNERARAFGGADDLPTIWTPELVQVRLRDAFETNQRSGGRVGPAFRSGSWPATLVEFADLIDAEARAAAEKRAQVVRSLPTSAEIAQMDQAFAWPLRFLLGEPMQADALLTWAYGQVRAGGVAGILKDRAKSVSSRIGAVEQASAAARRVIAARVIEDANAAIAAARLAGDANAALEARRHAAERFRAAVAETQRQQIRRSDALPNKVLSRTRLDHHRKRAAAAIATGLTAAGERVW
jgi:hypothetical protein